MLTDLNLVLAAAETLPNQGNAPGGFGEDSTVLAMDQSSTIGTLLRQYNDVGSGQRLMVNIGVTTPFTSDTFTTRLEFRLVSIPIAPSFLQNGGGGGSDGKLRTAAFASVIASNQFTATAHNLPDAVPVYITSLGGTTTLGTGAVNQIFWIFPNGANSFQIATTRANALAKTAVTLGGTTSSVIFSFEPAIVCHGSSGSIPIYNAAAGAAGQDVSTFQVGAGKPQREIQFPLLPQTAQPPGFTLPTGQTVKQPIGSGPAAWQLASAASRYFLLEAIISPTGVQIDAGVYNANLVMDAGDPMSYSATGVEVV